MNSMKLTAHRAGVVYLVFSIIAVIGEFMFRSASTRVSQRGT